MKKQTEQTEKEYPTIIDDSQTDFGYTEPKKEENTKKTGRN